VNVDSHLVNPNVGTRYLLLQDVGSNDPGESAPAWNYNGFPKMVAKANDIVEFNGNYWFVSFEATDTPTIEYVTNLTIGSQYKWEDGAWAKSVEGVYPAAAWRLVL
jgi:hypothetical protein